MEKLENLFVEYKYDLEELNSFINVLLAAAENEDTVLTHSDIVHNMEILHEKIEKLYDKASVIHEKLLNT